MDDKFFIQVVIYDKIHLSRSSRPRKPYALEEACTVWEEV